MRKALFLAVVLCLATVATAQAAADKLGVFNSRAVAERSEPFSAAQKKLEAQYAPEKKRLDEQMKRVTAQAEELQSKRATLTREAFAERSEAFMRAKRNVEDGIQTFSRKFEAAAMRIEREFAVRLSQAVQDYGKRSGYRMLLDTTMVPYYDRAIEVTEDIIKEVARVYREGKPIPGNQ